MSQHHNECKSIASHLAKEDFIRERINPLAGDGSYLHLSDLLFALAPIAASCHGLLLDFGCGGSPYQTLFPGVTYQRADIPPATDVDYFIGEDAVIESPGGVFDIILSTQVLEHVYVSNLYIAEAFRLLKPGGRLILSTHGSFFDH